MTTARITDDYHCDINTLRAENADLREQLETLKSQLEWFKRQLFGERSEKRRLIDPAIQADLLAGLAEVRAPAAPPPTETITYERRKRRDNTVNDSGLRFDESVPVETIHLGPAPQVADVPAERQVEISEKVTWRLAQRPGSYVILKYVRPVIKEAASGQLFTAPAPGNVLEGSVADVSFLAGMLVDKFLYHLPLYRQHQRLGASGITLSRATLTNLAARAIDLLTPVYDAQVQNVLRSRVLAMDETPIKAGRKARGKLRQAYFWPIHGQHDEVVFPYTPNKAASNVRVLLGEDFSGVLVSDGNDAYARYAAARSDVTHAECWAHTRRHFERALEADPAAAAEALELIAALYRHEQAIREAQLTGEAKHRYRITHGEPVVSAFFSWCETQCQRHDLVPSHPLARALKYAVSRYNALRVFLSDPEVPIDTNHLERALRPIPMGRRNWLFCWTELGARQVGIIQSLLVTCKLHGINPYVYLVDVLQRISEHPAADVIQLTPRVWKDTFAANPLTSDLDRLTRRHAD